MLLTLRTLCAIALAAATSRALPPAPIAGVPTPQELVSVKGVRQPLLGTITGETERELVFNPYRSTHAVMVYGIMRYPKTRVRSRRSGIPAHEEFHMSLIQAEDDADKLCGLAAWCKKRRLKQERLLALEAALRANPEHGAALKAMTKTRSTAFLHSDRLSNEDLNEALSDWLANEDADARARSAKALIKTYKLPYKSWYLARAFRSSQQPTGTIHDRKLTLQGDKIAGVYTLYVPGDYDPLEPTALFVGLHGGGPTDDGKGVLGNGRQAFGLYSSQLRKRNYIAVFPTALRAPWRSGALPGFRGPLPTPLPLLPVHAFQTFLPQFPDPSDILRDNRGIHHQDAADFCAYPPKREIAGNSLRRDHRRAHVRRREGSDDRGGEGARRLRQRELPRCPNAPPGISRQNGFMN